MAISGERSRYAWATPFTMLVAPGPRVDMQTPGLPVMSPQVEASIAPATSCFMSRNRIWRWRAASINSTDSPPGCPTMKGVPASLNAVASTSTVVDIRHPPGVCCDGNLAQFDKTAAIEGKEHVERNKRSALRRFISKHGRRGRRIEMSPGFRTGTAQCAALTAPYGPPGSAPFVAPRNSAARAKTTRRVVEPLFFNRDRTMKLSNQVAIVTGAGRNIGEEISKTLAAEGAKVALVDLDKGRGDRVAAEITKTGGEAAAFVADVAAETDIVRVVAAVVARWGRIDILVNNAAISDNKNILDIPKEQWDAVIAVTLTGPFLTSQHAARQMVAQGSGGKIVNIGSTSGFFGRSRAVAYAAAKGGVANLTRAMAVQL